MTSAATISVIIPAKDADRTVAGTIESLEPDKNLIREIILIDDHSRDRTRDIAEQIAREHQMTLHIVPSAGVGPGAARNIGIERSSGTYVFFLDADDSVLPGALQKLVDSLDRYPQAGIAVGTSIRRTDARADKPKRPHGYTLDCRHNAVRYFRNELWPIAIGSALVRTNAIGSIRFPESIRLDEDTCFWTALLCSSTVATSETPVLLYNLDETRMAGRYTTRSRQEFLRIAAAYAALSRYGLPRDAIQWRKAWLSMRMVRQLVADGHYREANKLRRLMRAHPDFRGSYREIKYSLRTKLGLIRTGG